MPSILNATTTSGLVTSADNSGSLQLQTNNGTTAVTVTTAQNVGVGVTNPTHKIAIGYSNADSSNKIAVGNIADYQGLLDFNNGNEVFTIENTTDYSIGGIAFKVNGANRGFFDINGNFQFNSGYGSVATAYGCRAWVNFNGTGTVAIRASGNVSSITDNGTGQYSINYTTSLPNANYSLVGTTNADTRVVSIGPSLTTSNAGIRTTNSAGALEDQSEICVSVFR